MKFLYAGMFAVANAQTATVTDGSTSPCAGDLMKSLDMAVCMLSFGYIGSTTTETCASLATMVKCLEEKGCMSQAMCDSYEANEGKDCTDMSCTASGCFPATATVELEGGKITNMDTLKLGDKVRVGPNEFSEVYFFSTQMQDVTAKFVQIHTDHGDLRLTPGHYLYVNGVLLQASAVKSGDVVNLGNGTKASVNEVESSWGPGLFNPHTLHGDIVVDGVLTSTYTDAVHPKLAHALLSPLRTMYTAGISFGSGFQSTIKNMPSWLLQAIGA